MVRPRDVPIAMAVQSKNEDGGPEFECETLDEEGFTYETGSTIKYVKVYDDSDEHPIEFAIGVMRSRGYRVLGPLWDEKAVKFVKKEW